MRKDKTFEQKLLDLNSHVLLLSEACDRFRHQHKLNEIINIAHQLRVLVCKGRGNNLLFRLAAEKGQKFKLLVLKNTISLTVTETEPDTNKIVQHVEVRR